MLQLELNNQLHWVSWLSTSIFYFIWNPITNLTIQWERNQDPVPRMGPSSTLVRVTGSWWNGFLPLFKLLRFCFLISLADSNFSSRSINICTSWNTIYDIPHQDACDGNLQWHLSPNLPARILWGLIHYAHWAYHNGSAVCNTYSKQFRAKQWKNQSEFLFYQPNTWWNQWCSL